MSLNYIRYIASRANNLCLSQRSLYMHSVGLIRKRGCHIVTEGFNGNLGDQALAKTMSRHLWQAHRRPFLIPYGSQALVDYTNNYPLIMAGGEIGDEFHFNSIRRYQPDPSRCSVIGISISKSFIDRPSPSLLNYLRHLRLLTIRDKANCQQVRKVLGLANARYSPDITFSLPRVTGKVQGPGVFKDVGLCKKTVIGINISTPFCCYTRRGRFVPDMEVQKTIKESDYAFDVPTAMRSYTRAMQSLIFHHIAKGCEVRLFSFSIPDTAFAQTVLKAASLRLPIVESFWDFSSMVESISRCSRFYASRYHAHIAAILANVPTVSIVMGHKNLGLLADAGVVDGCHYVTRNDMCSESSFTEKLLNSEPFDLPDDTINTWRKLALASIKQCTTD